MSIPVVDWNDNEQVVRGRWPGAFSLGVIWASVSSRDAWVNGTEEMPEANGYLGKDWHQARQHTSVQAYEAIHNPAKRPAEKVQDGGLSDDYRPSKFHLSNAEVRALGIIGGGAVENIALELLAFRNAPHAAALASHAQGETVTWRVDRLLAEGVCAGRWLTEDRPRSEQNGLKLLNLLSGEYRLVEITTSERVVAERKAGAQWK